METKVDVRHQDIYPSRRSNEPAILRRQDPVVHSKGTPPKPLTQEDVQSYEQNGFIQLKELFSPGEVDALTRELNRLTSKDAVRKSEETITEPGSGAVRSIFRIHALSEVFDRLSRDPRLLNVARHLLGDDVYIHQSRVNLKPGFSGNGFYWHSDFETWHVEDGMPRMRAVSASIALTENTLFNGPLMLIPGSHHHYVSCVGETPEGHYLQSLKRQELGVPDQDSLEFLASESEIVAPVGPAGSVLFFECNTMHGSNSNITPLPRSNAFFVYNAVGNRVVEPFSGMAPRPEFIATRERIDPLEPAPSD